MRFSRESKVFLTLLVLFAFAGVLVAQDVPLRNWTVPPFDAAAFKNSGAIRPMTPTDHIQGDNPAVFVPVVPCRLHDSRVVAGGPGPILASTTRNYDFIPGGGGECSGTFSSPVIALSLNFSVVNTQGPGFILAYPTGAAAPGVSVLNYAGTPGEIRNNAAIVPVDVNGSFSVTAGVSGTDVIIDINGIFLNVLEAGTQLRIVGNPNDAVIRGDNTQTGAVGTGVIGTQAGSGWGVHGFVPGILHGARGVFGLAGGASGYVFGVKGVTNSGSFDSAGVKGVSGTGDPLGDTLDCGPCATSGVRGVDNTSYGVLGISRSTAVAGVLLTSTGTGTAAQGFLGRAFGTDTGGGAVAPWGVFSQGNSGTSGIKAFVDPHPTDPTKVITYISLEGPEAGTYFRGKGRFTRGLASIEVPENFRFVTDPEGLSIQVTPIGEMATVAVQSIGLDRIVVKGSRNVEFFYTVNGVRSTFTEHQVIRTSAEFRPEKADATMPEYLSEGQKRVLIQNGTYRQDGTINMETAKRLGWDRIWDRDMPTPPSPQPE